MAIQFIIDSAADVSVEEAKAWGVIRVALTVRFEDEEYLDGVNLMPDEFYQKLAASKKLPVTSQAAPAVFESFLRPIVEKGDTAIVLAVSSGLSGTCQSARLAADAVGGDVYVIDTENVCIGQRILLLRALELRDEGKTAEEIVAALEQEKKQVHVLALLDTLEYLRKGGRLSGAAAMVGTLLSIKPVVGVEDGLVVSIGKARGPRNGNNLLRELVAKCGGIDFERPFTLGYSGNDDSLLKRYIEESTALYEGHADHLPVTRVGSVIGTHVGPGAIAVSFFSKQ